MRKGELGVQILKQWKTEPEKWLFRILLVVFIASMVPVLYLSRYGFPNCDDFTYGLETHRVWNATHSFGEVLKTALAVTKETWQLWQGTWFSIFLMTLTPGVFGEKWYFLTTLLMAGMLGGSICVLMHTVFFRYISRAKRKPLSAWNLYADCFIPDLSDLRFAGACAVLV